MESEKPNDSSGARLGMWLFLLSEMMLFGGLFILYSAALGRYRREFHASAAEMDTLLGGINTGVLITSSFFAARSLTALKLGEKKRAMCYLAGVILLACGFLFNKYLEWADKICHGIYPNAVELLSQPRGSIIFFNLYYVMTGLHALHVAIGAGLFGVILFRMREGGGVHMDRPAILENSTLYWHMVDIIWIYLFPIFYLIT